MQVQVQVQVQVQALAKDAADAWAAAAVFAVSVPADPPSLGLLSGNKHTACSDVSQTDSQGVA